MGKCHPKHGYLHIYSERKPFVIDQWCTVLWKLKVAPWAKLFTWCILQNKTPTAKNLQKHSFYGPSQCVLCKQEMETVDHLFLNCTTSTYIWTDVRSQLHILNFWNGTDVKVAWHRWWTNAQTHRIQNLPVMICWWIQLQRNKIIFTDTAPHWALATSHLITTFHNIPEDAREPFAHIIYTEIIDYDIPWAYFDGSVQHHGCGGGILFHITNSHYYKIQMGLGGETNNFVEIISLPHLLYFSLVKGCCILQIFSDLQIIIKWFNQQFICHRHTFHHILDDALRLRTQFGSISCHHIYRKHNKISDVLSKEAMHHPRGVQLTREQQDLEIYNYYHRPFMDEHY